jgi:nitroreductase
MNQRLRVWHAAICFGVTIGATGKAHAGGDYLLTTASTGGTYHPVGVALSTLVKVKLQPTHEINLSAINSAGSGENIKLVRENETQFAILQGLNGSYAWNGTGPLEQDDPQEGLRAVTMLWQDVERFVVRSEHVKSGTLDGVRAIGSVAGFGKKSSGSLGSSRVTMHNLGVDLDSQFDLFYGGYGALLGRDGARPALAGYGTAILGLGRPGAVRPVLRLRPPEAVQIGEGYAMTHRNPVITQQLAHRSIRTFTEAPIAPELLETLLRCGQAAASSSFLQAYSVIRVTRSEVRRQIAEAAGGQPWIERAAELLVFCADLRRIDAACRRADRGPVEGYAEHGLASIVDVALMAQNVLLAAESVGLGGVFIGGIRNDIQRVSELLKVPELVVPLFGMCLGWPDADPEVKPRMPVDLVLHQDEYRDLPETKIAEYDARMAEYYGRRSSTQKTGDWTTSAAAAVQGKKRPHMLEFLRRQRFFRC